MCEQKQRRPRLHKRGRLQTPKKETDYELKHEPQHIVNSLRRITQHISSVNIKTTDISEQFHKNRTLHPEIQIFG